MNSSFEKFSAKVFENKDLKANLTAYSIKNKIVMKIHVLSTLY